MTAIINDITLAQCIERDEAYQEQRRVMLEQLRVGLKRLGLENPYDDPNAVSADVGHWHRVDCPIYKAGKQFDTMYGDGKDDSRVREFVDKKHLAKIRPLVKCPRCLELYAEEEKQ